MRIQRVTLTTTIDIRLETTKEMLNIIAFKDDLDSLVERNNELGSCVVTKEVLNVNKDVYNKSICASDEELHDILGYSFP